MSSELVSRYSADLIVFSDNIDTYRLHVGVIQSPVEVIYLSLIVI